MTQKYDNATWKGRIIEIAGNLLITFQMPISYRKCVHFDSKFSEVPPSLNIQLTMNYSALGQGRWEVIIWTNFDSDMWRFMASLSQTVLNSRYQEVSSLSISNFVFTVYSFLVWYMELVCFDFRCFLASSWQCIFTVIHVSFYDAFNFWQKYLSRMS